MTKKYSDKSDNGKYKISALEDKIEGMLEQIRTSEDDRKQNEKLAKKIKILSREYAQLTGRQYVPLFQRDKVY